MISAEEVREQTKELIEAYESKFDYLDEEVVQLLPDIETLIKEQAGKRETSIKYQLHSREVGVREIDRARAIKLMELLRDTYGYMTSYSYVRNSEGVWGYLVPIHW